MKTAWLIEAETFPHYDTRLIDAVRASGREAKLTPELDVRYRWSDFPQLFERTFERHRRVVFHGSVGLASLLSDNPPWRPTVYCNWANLECSTYYCRFAEYLLNADYVMLPFGELSRRRGFLFDTIGAGGRVFVRPNSCRKSFTGQPASAATFDQDLEVMGFYDVPPEALVLVSSPKPIEREWRFVVVEGQVVAGCQYKRDGRLESSPEVAAQAERLAAEVAAEDFHPDRAWVADVCRTAEGDYRLLEIGSVSCADLYVCDLPRIVEAVSKTAETEP